MNATERKQGRRVKTAAAAVLFLCTLAAAVDPVRSAPGEHVSAELTNITWLAGSDYLVEVSVMNRSSFPIDLPKHELRFSVQSEVLGQWIELAWRRDGSAGHKPPAMLSQGDNWITNAVMKLPVELPRLYRNHEGEVNMRLEYSFACPLQCVSACRGESTYWVAPGTSRWVLREGM